jgi:aryl-alcohol dehydrogenase-like predicted oxidoreductase
MEFSQSLFAEKRVRRLGLSATYRPGRETVHAALDAGVNLFFCFGFDNQMTAVLRQEMPRRRDGLVVVTGAYHLVWTSLNLRRTLEKRLRQLNTDYIDAFLLLGVPRRRHFTQQMRDELAELRNDPRVGGVGISTHDRSLAAELARNGEADILMVRYSAAHTGAEQEIFPFLERHHPNVLSYTATRWTQLLRRPRGWPKGDFIPSAAQCYRFVLSSPCVNACLTAPTNLAQFKENVRALDHGPLTEEEMVGMRRFGQFIHDRQSCFM